MNLNNMEEIYYEENDSQENDDLENLDNISLSSSLESINLNDNIVKRIINNRNKPRINYGEYLGSLAFDILWNDDTITREPIQNLINKETEEVNEFIIDTINDYKITAQKYPTNNRMCIMCYNKVYNGAFMCSNHCLKYPFLMD